MRTIGTDFIESLEDLERLVNSETVKLDYLGLAKFHIVDELTEPEKFKEIDDVDYNGQYVYIDIYDDSIDAFYSVYAIYN